MKNTYQRALGYQLAATWEKHKPLSLKWQRVISFNRVYNQVNNQGTIVFNDNRTDSVIKSKNGNIILGANHEIGYYPNTRTNVRNITTVVYNKSTGALGGAAAGLANTLVLDYFLSYRSRISGSVNVFIIPISSQTIAAKGANLTFNLTYIN